MELIIAEPLFLPSLLKSHHHYYHRHPHSENTNYEVKLRNRPMDIQQTPLSIDESLPVRIKSCNLFHSVREKKEPRKKSLLREMKFLAFRGYSIV